MGIIVKIGTTAFVEGPDCLYCAMTSLELHMVELKKEIDALCAQIGQPPGYPLRLEEGQP